LIKEVDGLSIYSIEELVTVAKRDNNTKRPYLYVNPIQGKHIPVTPSKPIDLFEYMGSILDERYPNEDILVIGFAETATAVGAGIACSAKNVKWCMQTTREKYEDAEYLFFTESHSHATEQSLITNNLAKIIGLVDRIVFAEDEVTTGNTIMKLINSIKVYFPNVSVKYTILSILNSMSDSRIDTLKNMDIDCLYVDKIPFEYKIDVIDEYEYIEFDNKTYEETTTPDIFQVDCLNLRYVCNTYEYIESVERYVQKVISKCDLGSSNKILVLGTEEFMFPPLVVAKTIEELYPDKVVVYHATTRSPIMVSHSLGYPLHKRNVLMSLYDANRLTYVYNLTDYDMAIVLSDSKRIDKGAVKTICGALNKAGCKRIMIGRG